MLCMTQIILLDGYAGSRICEFVSLYSAQPSLASIFNVQTFSVNSVGWSGIEPEPYCGNRCSKLVNYQPILFNDDTVSNVQVR